MRLLLKVFIEVATNAANQPWLLTHKIEKKIKNIVIKNKHAHERVHRQYLSYFPFSSSPKF